MDQRQILSDQYVVLRPPRAEDIAERIALGSDHEIHQMLGGGTTAPLPTNISDVSNWLDALGQDPYAWVVEHEGKFLGEVRLRNVDRTAQVARLFIGFYDARKLGLGLGRKVVRLVLRHAFDDLSLRRINLRVASYNMRAIRCYQGCGFAEVGREPAAGTFNGRSYNDVTMEATAP